MDSGGGGPAPFLLKTYDMVDDLSTDAIVSWTASGKSFVVWNPPEFARVLLPSYFKHNNFSSFIRQLNTYGFRKIDPERWEFANEDFVKDQRHNLKSIHRRKPIHSHSQPQGSADAERAAFEEEIDSLSREKAAIKGNILAYDEQQAATTVPLEYLIRRIGDMEQRQERLLNFLDKAVQNPEFAELLAQKLESMDFSAYNKKRRLPEVDHSPSVQEKILIDNQSSSGPEFGNICPQDFCDKLRLELSPAVSDINLLSRSTQSSNEDGGMDGLPRDEHTRTAGYSCLSETLELSDTGASLASFTLKMDSSLPCQVGPESPKLHSLQHNLASNKDDDCHISCLLHLSLASSPLEPNRSQSTAPMPLSSQENNTEPRPHTEENDISHRLPTKGTSLDDAHVPSSSQDIHSKKQEPAKGKIHVNDVFWEQFLTEKPGCSDIEEASPGYRPNYIEQEEKKSTKGVPKNTKGMEPLTL